jgi:hypothetical protein
MVCKCSPFLLLSKKRSKKIASLYGNVESGSRRARRRKKGNNPAV